MPHTVICAEWRPPYDNYILHYGIKNQKWGVRRFQNEDRTFTEAGKRRYYPEKNPLLLRKVEPASDEEKAKLNDRIKNAKVELQKVQNEFNKIENKKRYGTYNKNSLDAEKSFLRVMRAQNEVKDLYILKKLQNKKHISQHQINVADKYRDEGMPDEKARIQAYKRVRTEKIIAIAATTTVAMAGAQIAKVIRSDFDKIIPKGTTIQNLSDNPDKGVSDAFYAAHDERDKRKYLRLYGGDHMQKAVKIQNMINRMMGLPEVGGVDVRKLTAEAVSDMRIAGANAARDTANQLLRSDPSYRTALLRAVNQPGVDMMPNAGNLRNALRKGLPLDKKAFNAVNTLLVSHDPEGGQKAGLKLYEALRKKGYDGVVDLNDMWNSGYNARSPAIIFNGSSKLGNISRATIDPNTLKLGALVEKGKIYLRTMANFYGPIGVAIAGANSLIKNRPISKHTAERKIINAYKKKHPNTNLTNKQILENELSS